MTTQPLILSSQIFSQVYARVKAGGPYLDPSSFEVRCILNEAQKTTGNAHQEIERFITLGFIQKMCGNEVEMRHNFSCATKLDRSPRTVAAYCRGLIDMGFISEAQKEFVKAARPELGWLPLIDDLGFLSMAITPLNDFYAEAQAMKIADLSAKHIEDAKRIQKILQEDDVTDQMVGQMLDDAGEILRARHLMRSAPCPSSYRICEDPYDDDSISIRWLVPVATDTASEMTFEYVDRFVRRFDKMPRCIGFSFLGTFC